MSILVILTLPQLVLQQVTDKEGNSHIMGFKGAWKANNAFYQEQGLADQNALNKINELLLQGRTIQKRWPRQWREPQRNSRI